MIQVKVPRNVAKAPQNFGDLLFVDLLLPLLAINEVREDPVKPGYCIGRYAERWADVLAEDQNTRHGLVEQARKQCGRPWLGQIIIRSGTFLTMKEAVPYWLDSPSHKEILLQPRADRVGVGRAQSEGYYVIVVNFASDPK
jgi:hypothetical protein